MKQKKVEVKEHPKKKSNVFKWAAIVIVVIFLGAVGANLFYQNKLLQSSLDKTEDLLDQQRELDANDEAIEEDTHDYYEENTAISGTEADPEVEGQWDLDYNTYAKSNVSNLNVRSTPAISDNVIGMLQLGDRVEVLDTVKSELAAIQNGMLNKDTFIEIEGNDVLFKNGRVFQIIGEISEGPLSYRIRVDNNNHEAIIVKSNIDLIESEVWLKINFKNEKAHGYTQGYVYHKFLTNEQISPKMEVYHEVYNTYTDQIAPYLILRSEPQSKSQKIVEMSDGTKLVVLSKGYGNNGKWMKVRVVESGKVGYAHSKWIREIYEN